MVERAVIWLGSVIVASTLTEAAVRVRATAVTGTLAAVAIVCAMLRRIVGV